MNSRHDSPHQRKSRIPHQLSNHDRAPKRKFRAIASVLISALLAPLMIGTFAIPARATTATSSTISGSSTFNVAYYESRTWVGLLESAGSGIANATLDVTRHFPDGGSETLEVSTDQHGAFSVPVAKWTPVGSAPTNPGSIEIEWSGNNTISGSTFTVDLRIDPIDAVGMTVTHDAGDRGTADNPLPLGTEVTYDIYVAAALAGGQQFVTVEYSDPTALYRTKTEDVVLTDGYAQVALPVMRPGTAARSDDRYLLSLHSISYSYLNDMRPEFVAEFVSELQGAKYTRGFIFDWENEGYDAPVDGVIYQERGNNYPGTLLAYISALEYPELSVQGRESVSVTWAWVTEDELDRALTGDFNGLEAGMMQNSGNPPRVYINVPKVTGAEPLYLVATASAYENAISWIADMEPRVVLKIARDPSPIVPNFSLNMDSTTLKAGENVEFRTRLLDSDLKSPIRGTVFIHAEGPWGDRIIAQSATSSTMSGDNSTEQTSHGTVPLGTTRIHAEFEPADDFPWSAATQTSPTGVTVASTEAVLDDVDPVHLSLLADTAVQLELDQPLTTTASYQLNGVTEEYGAPLTGTVEFVNGRSTLTLPRATAPYQIPTSVVISPEPDTGVDFAPLTIEIAPLPAQPLTLNGPDTALAGAPTKFTATYTKAPQDSEEGLTFEVFTGAGASLKVYGTAPVNNGLATISATLPVGSQQVGVRLVRDGEVLQELAATKTVSVVKQTTTITVPTNIKLSHTSTTRVTGTVKGQNGPATSGTIKYQLTGLVGKHEGTAAIAANGTFSISLPASFEKKNAQLKLSYTVNDVHAGSELTVAVSPSPALTNTTVTLKPETAAYAGQRVKITARITDSSKKAVNGGKVTFYHVVNGKRTAMGSSTIKSGTASVTVAPAAGMQTYVAAFSGFGVSAAAESSAAKVSVAPVLTTVKVTVSGKASIGSKLTAMATTNASAKMGFQWYANGKAIKGATKSTYTVARALLGKKITVKVTATQGTIKKTKTSTATKKVSKSATTLSITTAKTVKFKKTMTIKVKVKSPGVTSVKSTIKLKVGKKTYSKAISKPGTYTFKVKSTAVGKGTKKITASLTLTKAAKKYSTVPSAKSTKVKVK